MITANSERQQRRGEDTMWLESEHGSTKHVILEFIRVYLPADIAVAIIRLLESSVCNADEQTVYDTDKQVLSLLHEMSTEMLWKCNMVGIVMRFNEAHG